MHAVGGVPDDDVEQMLRRLATVLALAFVIPASAQAAGGDYTFQGASANERSTVRAALNASSFDWGVVPKQITVHVGSYGVSQRLEGAGARNESRRAGCVQPDLQAVLPGRADRGGLGRAGALGTKPRALGVVERLRRNLPADPLAEDLHFDRRPWR